MPSNGKGRYQFFFRAFKAEWLPLAILKRNKKLRGGLRLTHTKNYADTDTSRAGASKKGWRLALLQGCAKFMKSLEYYGQDYRFPVGSGHVLIRGGANRPKGQGTRREGDQDQQAGRGKDGRQNKHKNQDGDRPGRSENTSYNRSFPAGGLVAMGRGRGKGPGDGAGSGSKGRGAAR